MIDLGIRAIPDTSDGEFGHIDARHLALIEFECGCMVWIERRAIRHDWQPSAIYRGCREYRHDRDLLRFARPTWMKKP